MGNNTAFGEIRGEQLEVLLDGKRLQLFDWDKSTVVIDQVEPPSENYQANGTESNLAIIAQTVRIVAGRSEGRVSGCPGLRCAVQEPRVTISTTMTALVAVSHPDSLIAADVPAGGAVKCALSDRILGSVIYHRRPDTA